MAIRICTPHIGCIEPTPDPTVVCNSLETYQKYRVSLALDNAPLYQSVLSEFESLCHHHPETPNERRYFTHQANRFVPYLNQQSEGASRARSIANHQRSRARCFYLEASGLLPHCSETVEGKRVALGAAVVVGKIGEGFIHSLKEANRFANAQASRHGPAVHAGAFIYSLGEQFIDFGFSAPQMMVEGVQGLITYPSRSLYLSDREAAMDLADNALKTASPYFFISALKSPLKLKSESPSFPISSPLPVGGSVAIPIPLTLGVTLNPWALASLGASGMSSSSSSPEVRKLHGKMIARYKALIKGCQEAIDRANRRFDFHNKNDPQGKCWPESQKILDEIREAENTKAKYEEALKKAEELTPGEKEYLEDLYDNEIKKLQEEMYGLRGNGLGEPSPKTQPRISEVERKLEELKRKKSRIHDPRYNFDYFEDDLLREPPLTDYPPLTEKAPEPSKTAPDQTKEGQPPPGEKPHVDHKTAGDVWGHAENKLKQLRKELKELERELSDKQKEAENLNKQYHPNHPKRVYAENEARKVNGKIRELRDQIRGLEEQKSNHQDPVWDKNAPTTSD